MGENQTCIVVGMGHAAAQLVISLRKAGWQGQIIWFGDEPYLPYQRPPLSKDNLQGEVTDPVYIKNSDSYDRLEIEYYTNTGVKGLNPAKKELELYDGQIWRFDKLVLATGGYVRKLEVPGSTLNNIFYLRTLDDATAIQNSLKPGLKAVIIGGGYIGLEVAASLTKKGLKVSVLEAEDRILQRVTSSEVSEFVSQLHARNGVEILCNKKTVSFSGSGEVQQVVCEDESSYAADIVVVGIGIIPATELAKDADLEIDNGILVNEFFQTSDPDIYAIGDVSNYPNPFYHTQLRIESVPNAMEQAKVAASQICGIEVLCDALPWFWSQQFDLMWQIAGVSSGYDQVIIRGQPDDDGLVAWYLKNDKIIAADCLNRPREFMTAKKLIPANKKIPLDALADENIPVKDLLKM